MSSQRVWSQKTLRLIRRVGFRNLFNTFRTTATKYIILDSCHSIPSLLFEVGLNEPETSKFNVRDWAIHPRPILFQEMEGQCCQIGRNWPLPKKKTPPIFENEASFWFVFVEGKMKGAFFFFITIIKWTLVRSSFFPLFMFTLVAGGEDGMKVDPGLIRFHWFFPSFVQKYGTGGS